MNEPTIQFPVTCPHCGREELGKYPIAAVADALIIGGNGLKLYAPCHDYYWTASHSELHQVRQYMGAWLR